MLYALENGTYDLAAGVTKDGAALVLATRNVIAGAGLTGGGVLSADRTFDVGAGTGITVAADSVGLDTANTRNVDHAAVTLTAAAGLTGGGDISASRSFAVGAGAGITVNADDVALDTASVRNVDHTAVSVTAGSGLTGGGDISATRTVNVGAGTGIVVNADDVAVDRASTTNTTAVGYLDIPDNSQSANYTLVIGDRGKMIVHPNGGGAGDTFTIPANASVAFPIGTAITILNLDTNNLSIAITTDTMTIAGTTTVGTRTLAQNGMATILKTTSTGWLITGVGIS